MRSNILILFIPALFLSCIKGQKPKVDSNFQKSIEKVEAAKDSVGVEKYTNEKWHFSMEIPATLKVLESELPGKTPVINVYDPVNDETPPYAIHEAAVAAYITILPEGFGVDAPHGTRKSFKEWNGNLPLSFEIDPGESMVYLLENGKPWAAIIRFYSPPPGWNEYGTIFIHYPVTNFSATCFNEQGDVVAIKRCDTMGGDKLKYSGEISTEEMEGLNAVLTSLYFTSGKIKRKPISDLIKIEQPLPNQEISSPLKIKGEARGYWFFEAEAPFKLVDKDYKILATGSMKAQGEWMTEGFVPFEAEVSFKAPEDGRGFLIFSRSNASGLPEHDRMYRLPVLFQTKN